MATHAPPAVRDRTHEQQAGIGGERESEIVGEGRA